MAPRARLELATLRLTAECSTVELPGSCATPLFSFYYSKQIHAMTIQNDAQNALALSYQASSSSCDSYAALSSGGFGTLGTSFFGADKSGGQTRF